MEYDDDYDDTNLRSAKDRKRIMDEKFKESNSPDKEMRPV